MEAFEVGKSYLIRTVTMYWVGRVITVLPGELILTEATWVADTGQYGEAIRKGTLDTYQVMPPSITVTVGRGAIVDAVPWLHPLPVA